MATVTMMRLVDDLDGTSADVSVTLTVDSKRYRVDLSKANFNEYIAPLVKAARPSKIGRPAKQVAGSKSLRGTAKSASAKPTAYSRLSDKDQAAIRDHLKRTRGRVSDAEVSTWRSAGKR